MFIPVRNLFFGVAVKFALNYILLADPALGILGAAFSTAAAWAVVALLDTWAVYRRVGSVLPFKRGVLYPPLIAAAAASFSIYFLRDTLVYFIADAAATLISLTAGFLLYFLLLVMWGSLEGRDLHLVPVVGRRLEQFLQAWGGFAQLKFGLNPELIQFVQGHTLQIQALCLDHFLHEAKRAINLAVASCRANSGSISAKRAKFTAAKSRSPNSSRIPWRSAFSSAWRSSVSSSSTLASTARGLIPIKAHFGRFFCTFSARIKAGKTFGTPSTAEVRAAAVFFRSFDSIPLLGNLCGCLSVFFGKNVGGGGGSA